MKRWVRSIALSLMLPLSGIGCASYCPMRWPRRDLWASRPSGTPAIVWPSDDIANSSNHTQQKEGVAVVADLIDSNRTKEVFNADLLRHRVQPLMVIIQNASHDAYVFRKTSVDKQYIPAAHVAKMASVSPMTQAVLYAKWFIFIIPGLLFDAIIEPASTLEFPGISEAAQRPPRLDHQRIRGDFMDHEIGDGEIGPNSSRGGIMFIHPPTPGSRISISLTLINARTQRPLAFEIPIPPATYGEAHSYSQSHDQVWDAVMRTAVNVPSWRVTATDKNSGTIAVRKELRFLIWSTAANITITIQKITEQQTQVTLQSTLQQSDSAGDGARSRTIGSFFEKLHQRLPEPREEPQPTPPRSPAQPDASQTSTSERGVDAAP